MSASTSAVQRLNMFWFLVLSAPMLIGIAIAGLVQGLSEARSEEHTSELQSLE